MNHAARVSHCALHVAAQPSLAQFHPFSVTESTAMSDLFDAHVPAPVPGASRAGIVGEMSGDAFGRTVARAEPRGTSPGRAAPQRATPMGPNLDDSALVERPRAPGVVGGVCADVRDGARAEWPAGEGVWLSPRRATDEADEEDEDELEGEEEDDIGDEDDFDDDDEDDEDDDDLDEFDDDLVDLDDEYDTEDEERHRGGSDYEPD